MRLIATIAASIAALVLSVSSVHAKEYGNHDPRRMLTVTETPTGKRYGIDAPYLDQMLNDLASHAKNFPPSFDSEQDRQRATRDAGMIAGMLGILVDDPKADPGILLRAATVNAIAHNLKIAGAAEKASSIFQRLLAASPDNPRVNYSYGMHLAGTAKLAESIPYLEKALAAGVVDAAFSLGMVHLSLGDKKNALTYLESYKTRAPTGMDVSKIIEAIQSGNVEVKRTDS